MLFLGLDTVDHEDLWDYGQVDSLRLQWIEARMEHAPARTPVVTFNHIPFVSAKMTRYGFVDAGVAPTPIRVDGVDRFRHVVSNYEEVLSRVGGRLEVALAGHIHVSEVIEYATHPGTLRFETAAAVVVPAAGAGGDRDPLSGVTVYQVRDGRVDAGEFVGLEGR